MPYVYDASKKATELTVKFQKLSNRIPLPLLVKLFSNLTKVIAEIFSVYKNDGRQLQNLFSDLINNETQLSDTNPAYKQIAFIQNLINGDLNSFKLCADGFSEPLDIADILNYAKTFGYITDRHAFSIIAEIVSAKIPKGNEWRKLQMWSTVDKHEIEAVKNKENIAEEKEQCISNKY